MTSIKPFRAFVSYCHADRAFAARLQRRLEAYRLPRRLADQVLPLPGQPTGRIGPIFRDRADLSAAVDLSQAVRDAIAASSALVVVASPDAVRSRWVDREIALFRALHPASPILVAHVRGEPGEALPAALRTDSEPLAADFRREGDGPRLAFLKIVAGLAGLPLDALVQRDAQRQLRRVTAVTLGAVLLALAMSALLVVALRAQAETERQRADAERLIEFMLTDLRKELIGDGRFRVMDAVNSRALEYYSAQGDLQRLPDASLERRARVLLAMGEDDEKRDRLDAALAKFDEAHRTTAATLTRGPQQPAAIFAHAQSEYWVGRVWERRKAWRQALASYREYDALARRLVAVAPENPKYLMEAGYGQMNLGQLQSLRKAGPDFGRSRIVAALDWFGKAAAKRPDDPEIIGEIANARAWLADSHYLAGDYARSLEERRRELASREKIAALDPASNAARFRVAKAQLGVGWNLVMLRRPAEARPQLTAAHWAMTRLMTIEPDNQQWRTVLLRIESAMANGGK
jgi:tetratricopeptide (TPR) repeat protein